MNGKNLRILNLNLIFSYHIYGSLSERNRNRAWQYCSYFKISQSFFYKLNIFSKEKSCFFIRNYISVFRKHLLIMWKIISVIFNFYLYLIWIFFHRINIYKTNFVKCSTYLPFLILIKHFLSLTDLNQINKYLDHIMCSIYCIF